jgi:hypothetical protein
VYRTVAVICGLGCMNYKYCIESKKFTDCLHFIFCSHIVCSAAENSCIFKQGLRQTWDYYLQKFGACLEMKVRLKCLLTSVKFSVINLTIFKFWFTKLSASRCITSECILKYVMHSSAETVRHLIILASFVMHFERYPL